MGHVRCVEVGEDYELTLFGAIEGISLRTDRDLTRTCVDTWSTLLREICTETEIALQPLPWDQIRTRPEPDQNQTRHNAAAEKHVVYDNTGVEFPGE